MDARLGLCLVIDTDWDAQWSRLTIPRRWTICQTKSMRHLCAICQRLIVHQQTMTVTVTRSLVELRILTPQHVPRCPALSIGD